MCNSIAFGLNSRIGLRIRDQVMPVSRLLESGIKEVSDCDMNGTSRHLFFQGYQKHSSYSVHLDNGLYMGMY